MCRAKTQYGESNGQAAAECARLDRERAAARAAFDWSAQTDANVLLRRHQNADHAA
ncbi:hypothetical protein AB0948_22210 [Streptomyces koyangensis]|uniref:hypothetical protein n=1 Tax=Streptomyces koyangensis TaxID=188770 RepID=UPI003451C575